METKEPTLKMEEQPKAEIEKVSKELSQDDLIKIQKGLPEQLQPLRECFTEPFKTFVQCGKSKEDLQK